MENQTLTAFHVMPLILDREAELAADAQALLASGVCTDIACIMTLVPESDPPEDKARILGERYLCAEMRSFPVRMVHGAAQIAGLDPEFTILAETDPCPHNRYSTGAHLMHAHYTGSIIEGCHGAKHWLTRIHTWQPDSGAAYRAAYCQNRETRAGGGVAGDRVRGWPRADSAASGCAAGASYRLPAGGTRQSKRIRRQCTVKSLMKRYEKEESGERLRATSTDYE